MPKPKVAIINNAIYPDVYKPVEHWSRHLESVKWEAFYALEERFPRPEDFSHIILTGSEASILERAPWVEREADFVRDAFRRNLAILGSCYGHQLLALALAGSDRVGRCREPKSAGFRSPSLRIPRSSARNGPPIRFRFISTKSGISRTRSSSSLRARDARSKRSGCGGIPSGACKSIPRSESRTPAACCGISGAFFPKSALCIAGRWILRLATPDSSPGLSTDFCDFLLDNRSDLYDFIKGSILK